MHSLRTILALVILVGAVVYGRCADVSAAADAASVPDIVGQLHALKALLDDGVLTPEEFGLAKRKVLR